MSSILELYQEILFTESMLKEILDGITGISEVDQGYINSNASEFKRLEQDKIKLFDSLGENACRMLSIGIVMDELVKLGFHRDSCNITTDDGAEIGIDCFISNQKLKVYDDGIDETILGFVYIVFKFEVCEMYYQRNENDDLRWLDNYKPEDLLDKVKELLK